MSVQCTINTPHAVSAVTFSSSGSLWVGSDDGTLRLYELPAPKVVRAIKSLGSEIASIATLRSKDPQAGGLWIASGCRAFSFPAHSDKMISTDADARTTVQLGEDDEDVLNELSISENGRYLAFSTDGGSAGVVELSTQAVTRMKTRHSSICGAVKFIPDRPSELISAGYDSALLHHDFPQGTLLSRFDITSAPPSSGVSLSPPFVLSTAVSLTGLVAASTADGRVWIGAGGEKRPSPVSGAKKKRSRKWDGLQENEGLWLQVAEGPVVAVVFRGTETLITCTLLGKLARYTISHNAEGALQAAPNWTGETNHLAKVNAVALNDPFLCVAGLDSAGKGIIEVRGLDE
ncbi:hypothetical protein IEO21_01878 [Rhodonia placenta]|uniref:WD40 repeat-like protein n=1 Tax=Rhodonia placenta TaxID=104341 RepID=A0A8H7U530_9APHY|nr:hypothetical protein IEO21_01878 [Postia placenta]